MVISKRGRCMRGYKELIHEKGVGVGGRGGCIVIGGGAMDFV